MGPDTIDKYFEQILKCPLCNTSMENSVCLYQVNHLNRSINVLLCRNCGLTYKSHIPTAQYFAEIYSQDYDHFKTDNTRSEIEALQHRLKRIGRPDGRLLDYGCGNGTFVLAALQGGWDAYGFDPFLPDRLADEILTGRCFRGNKSGEIPGDTGLFNCITMWATAEHLVDTKNTFLSLFSLLHEKGLLIFNCPFGKSMIALKNGADWNMAKIAEHLQFHTFESVEYLSSAGNMAIENIRICGIPYPFGREGKAESDSESDICSRNSAETSNNLKKNSNSGLVTFLINEVISKNRFKSKDMLAFLINKLKTGDHLEVKLRKNE